MAGPDSGADAGGSRRGPALAGLRRALPPARLVWIFLAIIASYSIWFLNGIGVTPVLVLPVVAVAADLGFASVRFERLRFPDAAIATGLFVALLLPPLAPLEFCAAAAFAAIALRHIVRSRGHPWFNPAAVGVLIAAVGFGLSPAWWVAVGPFGQYLVAVLGALLIVLGASRWRLPATFLLAYGVLAAVQHVLLGAATSPTVLVLQALDPATVFFALFLVPEPRTAPADAPSQVLYAGVVGVVAAFAPLLFPTVGLLIALVCGNAVTPVLRWATTSRMSSTSTPGPSRSRAKRAAVAPRWSIGRRVTAAVLVVIVLAGVTTAVTPAHQAILISTGPPPVGGSLGGCKTDNPSIPASTLHQLHNMLGPSVIRSYDSSTGVVVFYDPVNKVTITETDLYEDFGYAEFNGDDFAVSGCS